MLCAAVQGVFACGKEERPADIPTVPSSPENVDPGSLEFNIGIVPCGETFKDGWEQGDAIGLFAVESGTATHITRIMKALTILPISRLQFLKTRADWRISPDMPS